MKFAAETPNVLKATTTSGIFEILQSNNTSLEKIQKALEVSQSISNVWQGISMNHKE